MFRITNLPGGPFARFGNAMSRQGPARWEQGLAATDSNAGLAGFTGRTCHSTSARAANKKGR